MGKIHIGQPPASRMIRRSTLVDVSRTGVTTISTGTPANRLPEPKIASPDRRGAQASQQRGEANEEAMPDPTPSRGCCSCSGPHLSSACTGADAHPQPAGSEAPDPRGVPAPLPPGAACRLLRVTLRPACRERRVPRCLPVVSELAGLLPGAAPQLARRGVHGRGERASRPRDLPRRGASQLVADLDVRVGGV